MINLVSDCRLEMLRLSTLIFTSITIHDAVYITKEELIDWINDSYTIISGLAIVDQLCDDGLLKIDCNGQVLTTEATIERLAYCLNF